MEQCAAGKQWWIKDLVNGEATVAKRAPALMHPQVLKAPVACALLACRCRRAGRTLATHRVARCARPAGLDRPAEATL